MHGCRPPDPSRDLLDGRRSPRDENPKLLGRSFDALRAITDERRPGEMWALRAARNDHSYNIAAINRNDSLKVIQVRVHIG
jgi:hypothetical protein